MSTHEVSWSSFLRQPTSVERHLERGDVLLKRREGETLRLSRESSDAALREGMLAAVRLLTAEAARQRAQIDDRAMTSRLPWTRFLPDADRKVFAAEFLSAIEACADLGEFTAVGRLVDEWKATAALHAEGLAGKLKRPISKGGAKVERP
jgi:hypothetical protein